MQYENTTVKVYKIPDGQAQPNPPHDDYLGEVETNVGEWNHPVTLTQAGDYRLYTIPTDRAGNVGSISKIISIQVVL